MNHPSSNLDPLAGGIPFDDVLKVETGEKLIAPLELNLDENGSFMLEIKGKEDVKYVFMVRKLDKSTYRAEMIAGFEYLEDLPVGFEDEYDFEAGYQNVFGSGSQVSYQLPGLQPTVFQAEISSENDCFTITPTENSDVRITNIEGLQGVDEEAEKGVMEIKSQIKSQIETAQTYEEAHLERIKNEVDGLLKETAVEIVEADDQSFLRQTRKKLSRKLMEMIGHGEALADQIRALRAYVHFTNVQVREIEKRDAVLAKLWPGVFGRENVESVGYQSILNQRLDTNMCVFLSSLEGIKRLNEARSILGKMITEGPGGKYWIKFYGDEKHPEGWLISEEELREWKQHPESLASGEEGDYLLQWAYRKLINARQHDLETFDTKGNLRTKFNSSLAQMSQLDLMGSGVDFEEINFQQPTAEEKKQALAKAATVLSPPARGIVLTSSRSSDYYRYLQNTNPELTQKYAENPRLYAQHSYTVTAIKDNAVRISNPFDAGTEHDIPLEDFFILFHRFRVAELKESGANKLNDAMKLPSSDLFLNYAEELLSKHGVYGLLGVSPKAWNAISLLQKKLQLLLNSHQDSVVFHEVKDKFLALVKKFARKEKIRLDA